MDVETRQLRCLIAIVDEGTFTDAAIALGVSQAAVSRTLAALERGLGIRLLRRTSREIALTPAGHAVLARARRVLGELDDLVHEATSGHRQVRIGYAWSALGGHTAAFQRGWAQANPDTELQLVRVNSGTAGLAEGTSELAVVRRPVDDRRFESAIVGLERRMCAVASDDPLARKRSVRLADLAGYPLLVDRRTGTTTPELWPDGAQPRTRDVHDVDDWLTAIAAGGCVGVTAEATAHQYPRPGLAYRPVRDAGPVAVRVLWWRDDPHPAAGAVIELVSALYRGGSRSTATADANRATGRRPRRSV